MLTRGGWIGLFDSLQDSSATSRAVARLARAGGFSIGSDGASSSRVGAS